MAEDAIICVQGVEEGAQHTTCVSVSLIWENPPPLSLDGLWVNSHGIKWWRRKDLGLLGHLSVVIHESPGCFLGNRNMVATWGWECGQLLKILARTCDSWSAQVFSALLSLLSDPPALCGFTAIRDFAREDTFFTLPKQVNTHLHLSVSMLLSPGSCDSNESLNKHRWFLRPFLWAADDSYLWDKLPNDSFSFLWPSRSTIVWTPTRPVWLGEATWMRDEIHVSIRITVIWTKNNLNGHVAMSVLLAVEHFAQSWIFCLVAIFHLSFQYIIFGIYWHIFVV